jgi:hypothetical protein|tara:strand:+ start:7090 stop:7353 length:264 start_codon:yes stop_codon:yes gene_type:complete
MEAANTKDDIYETALNQFGKKLDRRMKLSDLAEQLSQLEEEAKNPTPTPKARKPKAVRNVVTGNVFQYYLEEWEGNPNLEVIEWEDA